MLNRLKLNQKSKIGLLPEFSVSDRIPKILHQTYKTKDVPSEYLDNINQLKRQNPSWEFVLYDDADIVKFIKDYYGDVILDYYNRISPKYGAARADLFRYLLIYKKGGVYLDIKSSLEKPLDTIIYPDDQYILSHWGSSDGVKMERWNYHPELTQIGAREFQQWHIIAASGHPFIKRVIEYVLQNIDDYMPEIHGIGQVGTLRTTGPIAYTSAIYPILHLHHHRLVENHQELGLKYSIYDNPTRHRDTSHYTEIKTSLINLKGFDKVLSAVLRILFAPLTDKHREILKKSVYFVMALVRKK